MFAMDEALARRVEELTTPFLPPAGKAVLSAFPPVAGNGCFCRDQTPGLWAEERGLREGPAARTHRQRKTSPRLALENFLPPANVAGLEGLGHDIRAA